MTTTTYPLKVNINQMASVKLTKEGVRQYYQSFEEFGIITNGPELDQDGYYKDTLWGIMQKFGPKMFVGGPLMFETDIILHE